MSEDNLNKSVQELIQLGRDKGYLTYEDIHQLLPSHVVDAEQISSILALLHRMQIEILDSGDIDEQGLEGLGEAEPAREAADAHGELVELFRKEIESYEDHLFGVSLFYGTMPKLLRWTQKLSFNRVMRRGRAALESARELLRQVESEGKDPWRLTDFKWPPRWPPMELRARLLLELYDARWGAGRPRRKLSSREAKELRRLLMHSL